MRVAIFLCATACLLIGCATNPYQQYYHPVSGISEQLLAERRVAPPTAMPELYHSSQPNIDGPATLADGFVLIGTSTFKGPSGSEDDALKQGKAVGADRVLIFSRYAGVVEKMAPRSAPGTVGHIAYGSSPSRPNSTRTIFEPTMFDRYDFAAAYFVRFKHVFGAVYRNLNLAETKRAGSVNGVTITTVVRGSQAAASGLLPGDLVTKADDEAVIDAPWLVRWIRQRYGQEITLSVIRNDRRLTIPVSVGTFD
jgi:membrane-associated protease RseP (regulator of RpoE activity)